MRLTRSLCKAARDAFQRVVRPAIIVATALVMDLGYYMASAADISARPNVLLILADDLGYGDLQCYNRESKIPTPRLDRLATEGMRFTDAHSPSSVCSPTRYGLLTGRYAWRTRMKSGVLNGYSSSLIEPQRWTLASLLKVQGYRTACIGKWHLGLGDAEPADYGKPFRPGPREAGFDESFVLPASLDMPPYVFVENGQATTFPSEHIGDSKMRRYGGDGYWRAGAIAPGFKHVDTLPTIARTAQEFIARQSAERPFFLYLPLAAPHTPWMPTDEFRGRTPVGYYGEFVAQVDATVGRLLDLLAEKKLADNTLVIFTSDNGAHWLSNDIEQYGHRSNGSWRGMKADVYEGGHRVPMIVRWPGVVAPGSQSEQLVCLTDWMATLAEIVAQPLPPSEGPDSYSLYNTLTGRPPLGAREAIVHHSSDGTFAIRKGPWKLATKLGSHGFTVPKHEEPQAGGPQGQLYHLAADPSETNNRWLDEPAIVRELTELLTDYQTADNSRPRD